MEAFTKLSGIACPLPLSSVDTDQLIPARFMKRSRAEGYGGYLLHDLRFDEAGAPRPDFPLNALERQGAQVIVARRNFGSGSSREAAVYALVDYGIRCVIAPSFGDIFASNSVNNGLLPAKVAEADGESLIAALEEGARDMLVDLEACRIVVGNLSVPFTVDPVWRTKLLNGWDDIDLTMSQSDAIKAFVAADAKSRPWAMPRRGE
ncbi:MULTISPECIES: 3-isopropylmalate dehydratase small subunit [unclassified Chelatococcus]|uniref:3-isopropylmalate dehydratase small subunit n=1 Tax=unclassified Chelatococcus TaxID=2638111 RepID=UPI001BCB912B|nr:MULTISPECIES: 3-isopropylmalate dehydratase small subunit [unclassified Chelatococcus]MBS7697412.1 3-isopropylmalate dehydratase small subunit [Chelatococcus sp. YT9]MBX3559277.1 3-isopropylmalate dehydratase small subunit [Chelatococcus sp.]